MTAKERYEKCKTISELKNVYHMDKTSVETIEDYAACGRAYQERYSQLLHEK